MLDILQLRINPDEFDQLRICQIRLRSDCHAAFTVNGPGAIWPVAHWRETPVEERINVREWFPVLDKMADEFLIWRPQGGSFFVLGDRVVYRLERSAPGVLFLKFELNRLVVVPTRQFDTRRAQSAL